MTFLLSLLTIAVLYYFVFVVAARVKPVTDRLASQSLDKRYRFVFLIPAYREDAVIISTIQNLVSQPDRRKTDDIMVVADQLQTQTITQLRELGAQVLEVAFPQSTKTKAIQAALATLPADQYDAVILLDADNHLQPGFVTQANTGLNRGWQIMQGHRIAKNLDTSFARLDALSEELNNTLFRQGHRALGLSAALIGSGIVMDYTLFYEQFVGLEAIGGFDKKLELNLLRAGYTIHYLPAAYVLDEKVRGAAVFQTQRTRWLAAQWQFAKESIGPACWQLITKGNVDYLDKAFQFILPPRILLFGLLGFVWFISLFMGLTWLIWSSILLVLTALTLLLGIPPTLLAAQRWQDIRQLPKAFGLMVLALTRIRHARRRFLHTPHTS